MSKHTARRWIAVILLVYLGLGGAYSVVNPLFESPDESLNYANIRHFIEERRLPVLEPGKPTKAHHPPLYYALGALLTFWVSNEHFNAIVERTNPFWAYRLWEPGVDNKSLYLHNPMLESFPYRDVALGVHLIRWLSLLMGAGTVLLVYTTACEVIMAVYGGRGSGIAPPLAVAAAALVAFNPMFLYISGSVHDDPLANLVSAAMLHVAARILTRGATARRAVTLGVLMGLGILSKLTCLLVMPTAMLALLYHSLADQSRRGWREAFRLSGIAVGLALLIGGWWFVRNWLLYGEPTAMVRQTGVWGVRANAPDLLAAARELGFLHNTLWGVFGYGQIPFPHPIYGLARLVGLAALGGLLLLWARHRTDKRKGSLAAMGLLATAPLVALAVNFARMTVSAAADFGRYLFVALAVLAPLYVLGLAEWFPDRRRAALLPILALAMLALAVYGLVGVLAPAYAPPPRYASADEINPRHPADVTYPGLAHLIGYDTAPDPLHPGDVLRITFYWQVLGTSNTDYTFFVQVFGRGGTKIGARDTHPGLGRYPTSRWQPGEVIADTVPVPIEADADAPVGLRLDTGFYLPDGPRLAASDGRVTVSLGPVRLAAREPATPTGLPAACRLGDGVRLVAWEPDWSGPVRPGETLLFTLYWACDAPLGRPLNVFVHLAAEDGLPMAQGDGPPMGGDYPTQLWAAGDMVADPRVVALPNDLPPGRYKLLVGLYSLETGERLPAFDASGARLANDAIPLAEVEVRP